MTAVAVGALVVFNAGLLVTEGAGQAQREAESRARVLAARDAVVADPTDPALLAAPADPLWAPDLLGSDLLQLTRWGQLP